MGKRIVSRARGKGGPRYQAHSFRYHATIKHRRYDEIEKNNVIKGKIVNLINCPGHTAPLAEVLYENNENSFIPAPANVRVDELIESGIKAAVKTGNTLPLSKIPDGTLVYNLEIIPGDGGKLCRSSGVNAKVLSHAQDKIIILLPSKKQKILDSKCRATVGVIAGAGRKEKPFVKAGKRHLAMMARGRLYPITSGVAMNAVDHPFGSGRGRKHAKARVAPRFAPAGRNVGMLHARKTGRGKLKI